MVCTSERQCVMDMRATMKQWAKDERADAAARSARNHDGAYLRLGINLGYAIDSAKLGSFETKSHGLGFGLDFAFGVTGGPLTSGFEFLFVGLSSPSTTQNGIGLKGNHSDFYSLGGFLLDLYPDPHRGLHFTTTIGFGSADINPHDNESTSTGFGLLFGGGYDAWVSDTWSLGLMGRVLYIGGATESFGSHHTWIPLLTASALWN